MSEEILINVTPRETRVALVENGMLQEVHVERASRRGYVGNIYKGKVSRVMPGMQAAFVEIGLDRAAFLHASDIVRPHATVTGENGEAAAAPSPPITELVRDGQDIVVQVVKDPIGTKGARLTTHLSIPSRYLVLLPYSKVLGVSVRIEDEAERQRLKDMLAALATAIDPGPAAVPATPATPAVPRLGYIVRTNAEGQSREALAEDIDYLGKLWANIQEQMARISECSLVLYSVGGIEPDSHLVKCGAVTADELKALEAQGARGVIAGQVIDGDGQWMDCAHNRRCISASISSIRSIPRRMMVVEQMEKFDALYAAIRGGLVSHLVVTASMAKRLLERFDADAGPA